MAMSETSVVMAIRLGPPREERLTYEFDVW